MAGTLTIKLVGEIAVYRDGRPLALPQSRKTRALLAYLALADRPHRREDLCDLLWDAPGDPRAALRWSLSKLRSLLSDGTTTALLADSDTVWLDFSLVAVDVLDVRSVVSGAQADVSIDALQALEQWLSSGYLNDLETVGNRNFQLWPEGERKSLRDLHCCIIGELMARPGLTATARQRLAGARVALDPLGDASNVAYLDLVLKDGGLSEARLAFDKVRAHYRAERQSDSALLLAWRSMLQAATPDRPGATCGVEDFDDATPGSAKPSLAVLDFADLGSREGGAVLANGLTTDLNSGLAQLPSLFVIARQSTAAIDIRRLTPQEIGARLGVRYLLGGSIQRDRKRVRTTVALTDVAAGTQLWADQFDRPLDDIFQVQDDITNAVIAAIEPAIERAEMERALLKPPESLTAWEQFHRGLWHCFRFTQKDNEIAHGLFAKAVAIDPHFSRAFAGLSFTHYSRAFLHSVRDVDREVKEALDAGRQSVDFDGRDAMGHWALGRALFLSRRHDNALIAIERALDINPNYAQGHYARGFVGIHAGLDGTSLPSLDRAQRLSPFDPLLFAMKSSRAISLAHQGHHSEAASWAVRATQEPNAHFHIYAIAAACLELAGRSSDARNHAAWAIERQPQYSIDAFCRSFPHKDEAIRGPLLAALERAGIPRD